MKWQPIETAPKDGTEVVLWVGTAIGGYSVHRAFYRMGHWRYWDGDSHPLENFERPTHWLMIVSPEKEATPCD
jgi:hypothetical protein